MILYDQNIWGNFGVNDAVWNRKYLVNEMVREQDADICCFQECNPGTMRAGKDGITGGHGGGDEGIVKTLYSYLNGEYNGDCIPDIEESCYNHMIVFAAEESRISRMTVDVNEFLK